MIISIKKYRTRKRRKALINKWIATDMRKRPLNDISSTVNFLELYRKELNNGICKKD